MKRECFLSDTDTEVTALTTSQMREVDRIAMKETGPNLFQMMENACRNLAEMALERLGGVWQKARVVVLAGTGGIGGGGQYCSPPLGKPWCTSGALPGSSGQAQRGD